MAMREAVYNLILFVVGMGGGLFICDLVMERKQRLWIGRALKNEGITRDEHEALQREVEKIKQFLCAGK